MTDAAPATAPAPSRWAWVVWIVGVAGYVIAITNRTSLAAVGVDTAERFHADASTLSLFAVIQLAVYGIMQIPVGLLLDRFGARPLITVGMLLMAAGQLALAFADHVGLAIAARMLIGAGDAAIFPSVLRLVALWFDEKRSPLLVQLTGILGQLGQIVSVLPLAALLHATTWEVAFGSLAGTALLFAVLSFAIIRNEPPGAGGTRKVVSAVELGRGFRDSWAHPATRLAFWTHFTTPFAGTAFVLLWGFPFMTVGLGVPGPTASLVMTVYVLFGLLMGPIIGALSGRHPMRRSRLLALPIVAIQAAVWLTVILWPGAAPAWMLFVLAFALSIGGPASMVAFDHARAFNPSHRLSTATGIVNVGGFLAALIAILLIGIAMDVQGAGTPATYSLAAFKVAFLTQVPLWMLGSLMIAVERKRTRIHIGLDAPRAPGGRRASR